MKVCDRLPISMTLIFSALTLSVIVAKSDTKCKCVFESVVLAVTKMLLHYGESSLPGA